MQPRPRPLLLNLLLAAGDAGLSVREAIASGALFGIEGNSIRVALTRLAGESLVAPADRGHYVLGPAAVALAHDVATWRSAEARTRPWRGGWIAVHVGNLRRSDRAAQRVRKRALTMLGLRELDRGLYLRPDNLAGGLGDVRERLLRLGLDREAVVFAATGLDAACEARARALWQGDHLDPSYRSARTRLERWRTRAHTLTPQAAAREAYVLGNEAIRQLVFDPLLPAPLVDVRERRAFAAAVRRHDALGRGLWRRFHDLHGSAAPGSQCPSRRNPSRISTR